MSEVFVDEWESRSGEETLSIMLDSANKFFGTGKFELVHLLNYRPGNPLYETDDASAKRYLVDQEVAGGKAAAIQRRKYALDWEMGVGRLNKLGVYRIEFRELVDRVGVMNEFLVDVMAQRQLRDVDTPGLVIDRGGKIYLVNKFGGLEEVDKTRLKVLQRLAQDGLGDIEKICQKELSSAGDTSIDQLIAVISQDWYKSGKYIDDGVKLKIVEIIEYKKFIESAGVILRFGSL